MPITLSFTSAVDAPVAELFDLMADPATEERWNPDALAVRRLDEGPIRAGAQWDGRYKGMGTMHITLDDYERPNRLVFTITGNRMDMHWTFGFLPDGTSTQLTAAASLRPRGPWRLLSPLLGPMMRRTFAKRPAQLAAGVAAQRAVPQT
jgi:uncharacterized protein YndB with AHSA1/START domain